MRLQQFPSQQDPAAQNTAPLRINFKSRQNRWLIQAYKVKNRIKKPFFRCAFCPRQLSRRD
jgi:hypothetical protein